MCLGLMCFLFRYLTGTSRFQIDIAAHMLSPENKDHVQERKVLRKLLKSRKSAVLLKVNLQVAVKNEGLHVQAS